MITAEHRVSLKTLWREVIVGTFNVSFCRGFDLQQVLNGHAQLGRQRRDYGLIAKP